MLFEDVTSLGDISYIHAFFYKQHFYKQRQAEIGETLSKS